MDGSWMERAEIERCGESRRAGDRRRSLCACASCCMLYLYAVRVGRVLALAVEWRWPRGNIIKGRHGCRLSAVAAGSWWWCGGTGHCALRKPGGLAKDEKREES